MLRLKQNLDLAKNTAGYTLIELVVVLSIIGLATVSLIGAFQSNTKVERFGGNVREFASHIREAQTESYSVATEFCSGGVCNTYWRGAVIEYSQTGGTYNYYLLYGQDISVTGIDQRLGIAGKRLKTTFDLAAKGMVLEEIETTPRVGNSQQPSEVSLAFLAPDGKAYTANQIVSSFNVTSQPYHRQDIVTLRIRDQATGLLGTITFNAFNGTIETAVE